MKLTEVSAATNRWSIRRTVPDGDKYSARLGVTKVEFSSVQESSIIRHS
jgi:hypothetical protein